MKTGSTKNSAQNISANGFRMTQKLAKSPNAKIAVTLRKASTTATKRTSHPATNTRRLGMKSYIELSATERAAWDFLAPTTTRSLITTPCDETLPEWMTVALWAITVFIGGAVVALGSAGWFNEGMPSLWPAIKAIL
jgi:hypothetical protein